MPIHHVIIISVSPDPLHLENVERGKNIKKWIPQEQKEFFHWKKAFSIIFEMLSFGKL